MFSGFTFFFFFCQLLSVPLRRLNVHAQVAIVYAHGVCGLEIFHGEEKLLVAVVDGHRVAFREAGEICQGVFQHRFLVGDLHEGGVFGLESRKRTGRQRDVFDGNFVAFVDKIINVENTIKLKTI